MPSPDRPAGAEGGAATACRPADGAPAGALAGLNDEQRTAVEWLEGPLLIVAGAGTGKTRVLAHRISRLLEAVPGLTPDRLLPLTFSRKAAGEMQERVEQLLGAPADALSVTTFHAFCHQVLSDHGAAIGLPARLVLLDRVGQWLLFRGLLPTLPVDLELTQGRPEAIIAGFLQCIARAKDELVRPEVYAAYAQGIADPAARTRQTAVAEVYARYQAALRQAGALDFGDLLLETLRVFETQPALLAQYQAQYPYLLVDEFQDTNVAQIALLTLLAGARRNLCVVGDDDQAIYRFRGASYASFLLFHERFPDAKVVRLTQNYRSSPAILRTAERLIRGNGADRYDPQKSLWTARAGDRPVELAVCQDAEHEARVVADRIRTVAGEYRRIAVLYRAHAHRREVAAALAREGIPAIITGAPALLETEVIRDLLAVLRVLHDPADSVALFQVLTLPAFEVELAELVAATRAAKRQQRTLYQVLTTPRAVTLGAGARRRVNEAVGCLRSLQRVVARQGLGEGMRRLVEELGYRPRLSAAVDPQAQEEVRALSRWYRWVLTYLAEHPSQQTLAEFLEYLEAYQEVGGDPGEEPSAEGVDGVQLMTVHQAKGLEFDWVFVIGLVPLRFPSRGRPEEVPFPPALMKERLPSGDCHLQEERRLCYVALTRARAGLVLTTVDRPRHRPSIFVRELLGDPAGSADLVRTDEPPPALLEQAIPPLSRAEIAGARQGQAIVELVRTLRATAPTDTAAVEATIERLVASARALVGDPAPPAAVPVPPRPDATLSYSQLEAYRFCPRKYQYAYLYAVPTRPTPQMQLGTNLHEALEVFARRLMAGQVPTEPQLLELYEAAWRSDGYDDPALEARDRAAGRQMLVQYYAANRATLAPPLFVEKSFLLTLGGARIRGFIDRIDARPDGTVEVLDYKTGKPKTAASVSERLQLHLYAMACRDVLRLTPAAMSFYYLRTNQKLSFPYEEPAVEETRQTVTALADSIRAGDFTPTPEYGKCRICDFRTICSASVATRGRS